MTMARIVALLEGKQNRELLDQWLSQYHHVTEHSLEFPIDDAADLCIVDGPSLERIKDELQLRRDREQPGLFPVLLLTSKRDVWAREPRLWHYVDDVVHIPVAKLEIQARVEILLRARRLSQDLKIRNDDLEAFIQAMSHDLRASLRVVTVFSEALSVSQSGRLDEEGKGDIKRISLAAEEMRELIESLLNFSRLGRGEVRYQPIDLRAYIETCLRSLQAEISNRNAQVHLRGRGGAIHADPTLLKIALTNLLSNAIKFVPEGTQPEITISTSVRKDTCRIQVNDNGIGITKEDQQRIFLPFVRLHSDLEFSGIGLGLPSVRKAVELMGGRVGVESTLGGGSTFWIEMPR